MNTFSLSSFPKNGDNAPAYFQVFTAKGFYNVPLEEILFIECRQKKAILHTKTEELTIGVPLYRLGEELPAPHFLQCHRSFLVNLKNIAYIDKHRDPWTIFFFSSEKKAFISRSFRHQVMNAVALSD